MKAAAILSEPWNCEAQGPDIVLQETCPPRTDAERWSDYLEALPRHVDFATANRARRLWGVLAQRYSALALPIAGPGADSAFQFAWNREHHYLDIELLSDGTLAWTWLDRPARSSDGEEGVRFSQISARFFQYLERIGVDHGKDEV